MLDKSLSFSDLFSGARKLSRMTMERFWIIGFGKVGQRALRRLRKRFPDAAITIVEPRDPRPPEGLGAAHWHSGDGITFLLEHPLIDEDGASPWIVPALPRHLAYEWLTARLKERVVFKPCAVPEKVIPLLPNTFKGQEGQVYMSNADFICPENCNEPKKKCPVTGKSRPYSLYDHLARIESEGYRSLVVRSFQLAPGVGGYRGKQLTAILSTVQNQPGKYIVSTASKCHGVMHAFQTQAGVS
jgi:hypothetical protein